MSAPRKYGEELRERATRMAVEARQNHRRLHGDIGLVPPAEFEANHWASTEVQDYPEIPALTEVGSK